MSQTPNEKNTIRGREISSRTALIFVVSLAVIATIILIIWGVHRNKPSSSASPTPMITTPSVGAPAQNDSGNTTDSTSDASATPSANDPVNIYTPLPGVNTAVPSSVASNVDNDPDPTVTANPDENEGVTDKPLKINGMPYSNTAQGRNEWTPVLNKFLAGLATSGNVYDATKNYTDPVLSEKLQSIPNGAFNGVHVTDFNKATNISYSAYSYSETLPLSNGQNITVLVSYNFDGEHGVWQVLNFTIK